MYISLRKVFGRDILTNKGKAQAEICQKEISNCAFSTSPSGTRLPAVFAGM